MTYGEVMKRQLLRRIICTLAAAVVMIICSMPAFALHNWASSYSLDIDLENAPEDAAYVDILVPAKNFGIDEFEDFHDTKITNYDKPAANMAANIERKGWPERATTAPTAAPRVKAPSVERSHTFKQL